MLLYHPLLIVVMIVAAGVGLCLGYVGQRIATQRKRHTLEERVRQVLQDAEREAESKIREALLEAKDSWYETKARLEKRQTPRSLNSNVWRRRFSCARKASNASSSIL